MTRTTPWRRTILQLRQIFFTDANTFISLSSLVAPWRLDGAARAARRLLIAESWSLDHFARNVIRARDRSYGVNSTVTLSPGRILM
jgi:hypothetical protein